MSGERNDRQIGKLRMRPYRNENVTTAHLVPALEQGNDQHHVGGAVFNDGDCRHDATPSDPIAGQQFRISSGQRCLSALLPG